MNKKNSVSSGIAAKIKQLEIFTRRLLNGALVGDSRSAIKGSGFEFDQIRDYSFGDDIRFIDWKASARTNKLLVKQYIEERSRTIFLAVDVSQSSIFGSGHTNKFSRIIELASVLALVGQHGKDHVGLLLFSDKIEEYIPAGSSLQHVHRVLDRMLSFVPKQSQTNISHALQHLLAIKKSDAIVFLISDFIDDNLDTYLGQAGKKYDLIAVRCLDTNEKALPAVGFITVEDLETGELVELDLRGAHNNDVKRFLTARIEQQNRLFKRRGIDLVDVMAERHDYLAEMVKFFRRRMMY
jgi:uncharacterized protein (DUF58 family)